MNAKADITDFEKAARQDELLRWYVIADSAQHRDLPSVLTDRGRKTRCLFGASAGSPIGRHAPHLVEMSSPLERDKSWAWISRHATRKPCVTIIAASSSFDELFAQLANCIDVDLPDKTSMFFAFWDPAILGSLVGQPDDVSLHVKGPILSREQQALLTAKVTAWWYWDRLGNLHLVRPDRMTDGVAEVRIRLTQQQVDELVEASVPDHVLYYLSSNQPHLLADVPSNERYSLVRAAIISAKELSLVSMRDIMDFVCLELILGKNGSENAVFRNLMREVKEKKIAFREALAEL